MRYHLHSGKPFGRGPGGETVDGGLARYAGLLRF